MNKVSGSKETISFALAQINTTVGDISGNIDSFRKARNQAARDGIDVLLTSELAVSGYPPEDLILKKSFLDKIVKEVKSFARETKDGGPAILLGAPWRKKGKIFNGGFFNSGLTFTNTFWKNLIFKINKNFSHKLIVLLSNLKLVPKIQIKFTSSAKIVEIINNSFVKKFLYNLKLLYSKEFVLINSSSFDIFKNIKMEVSEEKIVLLDVDLNHPELIAISGNLDKKKVEKHYYHLTILAIHVNSYLHIYHERRQE